MEKLLEQLKTWQNETPKNMRFELFWNGDEWGVGILTLNDEGVMVMQNNKFGKTPSEAILKTIDYLGKNNLY